MAQLREQKTRRMLRRLGLSAKPGIAALLIVAVVGGAALGVALTGQNSGFDVSLTTEPQAEVEPEGDEAEGQGEVSADEPQDLYFVHVDGAVACPGVYTLSGSDLRIYDAVEAAGGLLEGADTTNVNLAAPVVDGSKVHIPTQEEASLQNQLPTTGNPSSANSQNTLININSATQDQLCLLPGVGEATAANIISDREQNGPFTCIEDLMRVSGIGEKKFERVKDRICV